jgi:uncharacterized membrane protein
VSTPFTTATAPAAVPPTREFTTAWIAYFLLAISTLLWWPALVALVINYSKRGGAEAGFIDSHHRWMIRTFWYSQLAWTFCFVLIVLGAWPIVSDVVRQAIATGTWDNEANFSINIDWSSIFTTVGAAMAGGFGMLVVWLWYVYRIARGMIALADARPLP